MVAITLLIIVFGVNIVVVLTHVFIHWLFVIGGVFIWLQRYVACCSSCMYCRTQVNSTSLSMGVMCSPMIVLSHGFSSGNFCL